MGRPRTELQKLFQDIIGNRSDGQLNVLFQPPSSWKLVYPCLVYNQDDKDETHANNKLYQWMNRYLVTIIDQNPDSNLPQKISELPYTSFVRAFSSNNLNHIIYAIYF